VSPQLSHLREATLLRGAEQEQPLPEQAVPPRRAKQPGGTHSASGADLAERRS